jgi:hypothetical protein
MASVNGAGIERVRPDDYYWKRMMPNRESSTPLPPGESRALDHNSSRGPKKMAMQAGSLFDQNEGDADNVGIPSVQPILRGAGAKKTISDLQFPEAILAVKESTACRDLKELQVCLTTRLGQNSQETRLRYARFLIRWFFADGLDGIARKTWVAYQDEKILTDILRYLYLAHEPVMGTCVAECLFPVELGMRVPASLFNRFLSSHYGGMPSTKTTQRLKSNLMRLGVLERSPGADDKLVSLSPTKTSLMLLTHHIFAPTEPRTIELRHLLANPFWKYLGFKREDEVRAIFREADATGCIGKYVVADQLEQLTTCLTLDAFLSKKVRL